MNPNTFALIGAAGFVAPRHMKAIHDTGNRLVAALDPSDSVGIIDSYFPEADFFTEFERFDRHIDKLRRQGRPVDYISICSPNYLHDAHTRFALRSQAHAICEKPLVLNPWNIDGLQEMEQETGKKVFNILQLRLHPAIIQLKEHIQQADDRIHDVEITYITSRGNWYHRSWKGQVEKSGGIATNIGVHFFDMLAWVFGDCINSTVHINQHERAAGYLEMKNARVRWFLSVNAQDLPPAQQDTRQRTYRSITVNDRAVEFSDGFTDLHTLSYQAILAGQGYGLDAARTAVEMVYRIRNEKPAGLQSDYHPFCNRIESKQSK
ncbi:Gfo/Idh/MocA family oxidoreductase [Methylotuvimicrobium buryatense]|uniref:Gfo/Idh/MocA family oxidoreductase n=1 Tax=Methylotuvimicrobium buryatense TaxID=95641 RepID=A0A4P9UK24_METBY|nr:Gfo/Idh/MocA family oxidoreductase [Methylotuvimicrobium buryatense]QCW81572.1 Gfo/Idh/MocA family oxidoreductase [Methylotuvimicrobium buryatense]